MLEYRVAVKFEQSIPLLFFPPYLYGTPYHSSINEYSFIFSILLLSTFKSVAYFPITFSDLETLVFVVVSLLVRQEDVETAVDSRILTQMNWKVLFSVHIKIAFLKITLEKGCCDAF